MCERRAAVVVCDVVQFCNVLSHAYDFQLFFFFGLVSGFNVFRSFRFVLDRRREWIFCVYGDVCALYRP